MDLPLIGNRYRVLESLSTGDRSQVLRAEMIDTGEVVVIKRHAAHLRAFHERETLALTRCAGPHVVRLLEASEDQAGPYMVLEFVDGVSLSQWVKGGVLMWGELRLLAQQSIEALAEVHAAGFLHRDLAPDNLILSPSSTEGEAFWLKLVDFELAQEPGVDMHDAATGSVHHMAPEQFGREALDFRTDLYALGSSLYFAASGQAPFECGSNAQVITAVLHGRCAPLEELRPDLPRAFCQWIARLMSRDRNARPNSARAALATLPGG